MNKIIKTKNFNIGEYNPAYIIAEIGSNHNGSFDLACELIEKAKVAGANAVKFQTFKAEHHYSKNTPKISLYKEDIYGLIESLEIDRSWHVKLSKLCQDLGMDFMDSPCDFEAIELANSVDMDILKVASFDMVDSRLVRKIAQTGRGVMLSTGMANLSEIQNAINICHSENNNNLVLLQCTSLYPAPAKLTNLNAMKTLKQAFGCIVGYSDHTLGDHIACAAVANGAKVIEKHYTFDKNAKGPDHQFAIEPNDLKDMISKIREIEGAMGDGIKNGPREEELEMYKKARRSILASKDLIKGDIITEESLVIKRPGFGISPLFFENIIGMKLTADIKKDEPINWNKF
jgi:N,N'-diacetyllegionaminate synthase